MTTIDTSVKGTYRIENDRGELLAEVDNAITDLGMIFLAGHPYTDTNNYADVPNYFQKGMLAVMLAQTTSGEILIENDSTYFSKVVPRTDGLLQINTIVKKRCVFTSAMTITHLRTGYVRGIGYTSARTSEAALPSPGLSFQAGEAISVTYTLQFVTNCNRIIENMPFAFGTGVNMPPNRTNVRNSPIVTYPETGLAIGDSWNTNWGSVSSRFRACLDLPSYKTIFSPTYINDYVYSEFNLFFYSDVDVYDAFGLPNASTTATSLLQPAGAYDSASNTVKNYIYKKRISSIKYTSSGNTWSTSLRFLFEPGEWPVTAKGFSLLLGSASAAVSPSTERANAGIFTALQSPYNPYKTRADMVVGIDYKFNWTRG